MVIPIVILVFYLAATVVVGAAHASLVLLPAIRALRRADRIDQTGKTSFYLADLLALLFLIQLPWALINMSDADFRDRPELATFVFVFLALMILLVWNFGVRMLTKLRVTAWHRRLAFLCVALPIGLFGGFFVIPLIAISFRAQPYSPSDWPHPVVLMILLGAGSLTGYAITRWISNSVKPRDQESV